MRVLALNAGSSSLKASTVERGERVAAVTLAWQAGDRGAALDRAFEELGLDRHAPDAVAHRIVHGGHDLTDHVLVDDRVVGAIEAVSELAPLHNDVALETLAAARRRLASVPHVACFDTVFHASLPAQAVRYPVPAAWSERWGIRRFGFHGLSVEWCTGRAAELLGRPPAELGLVVAHLGSGCSVTAVAAGRSVWTSMGFTPLDGLMMRTRSGGIDPGIIVHLLRRGVMDVEELATELEHGSGLAGVGGRAGDVRELEPAADRGDDEARLALEMFAARAAAAIAAAATALPKLDGLIFTAGIGEHAGRVRADIVSRLAVLGIAPVGTAESGTDRVVDPGPPAVLRVEAREDVVMARAAERLTRG